MGDAMVVTMEEAQKIAKKKKLHLARIGMAEAKVHTDKPTYKLESLTQGLKEENLPSASDSDGKT